MTTVATKKTRNLKAHNKLLLDVIKRQAGTLEKAILEAGMNAVEAGSDTVSIRLDTNEADPHEAGARLFIEDQGKGFQSEKEIIEWFETFGTPHDASENKTWAQFRMGRGQLFSFGRNVWRTGEFRMVVDIDKNGLEYELETGLDPVVGCRIAIDLYSNPIGTYAYRSIDVMKSSIKRQIEFMEGTITFNGEQLNTPASQLEWDFEDENAKYMFGKGQDLAFYNLGAFVMTQSASRAGTTGVVVSKKMLGVNFARNDIQYSCPIYKDIQEVIKDNRVKKARKQRRSFNRNERIALLVDLRDGVTEYDEIKNLKLIELSNDKMMSLEEIKKIRIPWTMAPQGNRVADRLMYSESAVCFNADLLDELDYSGDAIEFFDWLLRQAFVNDRRYCRGNLGIHWAKMKNCYASFNGEAGSKGLASGFSDTHRRLPEGKWTVAEKRIIRALSYHDCWKGRTLCIGTSDTALAWTDGHSYICLERSYLKNFNPSHIWGASHVVMTMFHELAHSEDTTDTHHHGMEFYRNFHNIVSGEGLSYSPTYIMTDLPTRMKNLKASDYQEKVVKKETKAKAARDKALGLNDVAAGGLSVKG